MIDVIETVVLMDDGFGFIFFVSCSEQIRGTILIDKIWCEIYSDNNILYVLDGEKFHGNTFKFCEQNYRHF